MAKILALSGKKQSGKNTSANFLLGLKMIELGITHGIEITPGGELKIKDLWGDDDWAGIFRYYNSSPDVQDFLDDNIHPYYKIYSMADLLKRTVCMDLLGLKEKQCFGSDLDKNTETHLRWEDMPGVVTETQPKLSSQAVRGRLGEYYQKLCNGLVFHEPGPMTGREVMQFVGTEVFRKMYNDVWAKGTVNRIQKENSEFAVICDCRFPNEVKAVQEAGGKVIRFTRHKTDPDEHLSETALDNYQGFDAVIDNQEMTIGEQNGAVYDKLQEWGFPVISLKDLETNKE